MNSTISDSTITLSSGRRLPTELVPLRHPGRFAAGALALLIAALAVRSMIINENFEWATVWEFLFHPGIMAGLRRTLILTAVSMLAGVLLGIVLAVCRTSANRVLSTLAGFYLWFFRGTPLLIQLIFWYNLSALYPRLGLTIPFLETEVFGYPTNALLSPWVVALLALSLNEAAYMAEIIRGGLMSVPRHQTEAARALGMKDTLLFRRIVLPQALRVVVPPTGNQVIGMLKHSALVSIIAMPDLLYSGQIIYSQNFKTIPILIVVSFWYLLATSVLSVLQRYVEQYYGKGIQTEPSPGKDDGSPRSRRSWRGRNRAVEADLVSKEQQ